MPTDHDGYRGIALPLGSGSALARIQLWHNGKMAAEAAVVHGHHNVEVALSVFSKLHFDVVLGPSPISTRMKRRESE